MAASPQWKIYDSGGVYQAAAKESVLAAAIVCVRGDGSTVRHGHNLICWTEGVGSDGEAYASYDDAADLMERRLRAALRRSG